MTVYVDDMQMTATVGSLTACWSHLLADTSSELLAFAVQLGLRPEWLQKPGTAHEHFDLTEPKRQLALRLGARAIKYGHEGHALTTAKRNSVAFDLDCYRASHPDVDVPDAQLDLF